MPDIPEALCNRNAGKIPAAGWRWFAGRISLGQSSPGSALELGLALGAFSTLHDSPGLDLLVGLTTVAPGFAAGSAWQRRAVGTNLSRK
jgi:hypothetical protein